MSRKIVVGILFGGKSAEHEISLLSAKNIYNAIDRDKFEPVLIGIDKSGRWFLNEASEFLLNPGDPRKVSLNTNGKPVTLFPESRGQLQSLQSHLVSANNDLPINVVFPILHGPFGEDGTIQGLLKLADVPFVGSSVLGSAVCMDKDVMKRLMRDAMIPVAKFLILKSHEPAPAFAAIEAALGKPFFVKPANMGSSVGISKVHDEGEYAAAIKDAFQYDNKILIEEYIRGRELECAVLGNEEPAASAVGEIIPTHEFYSYDAKYLDENGAELKIPAKLDEQTKKRVQEMAIKTYQALCCEGLSRVDFFLKETGELFVNEINTMPGFTKISMYPKLWEESGITYTGLITRLIELAISRHEKERAIKTSV